MKKLVTTCVVVGLALGLASVSSADRVWDDGDPNDHLWTSAANWNPDGVPGPGEEILIDPPAATPPNGPVIPPGSVVDIKGFYGESAGVSSLTINDATVTGDWVWAGDGTGNVFQVSVTDSSLTFSREFELGWGGGTGIMDVTNSTITSRDLRIPVNSNVDPSDPGAGGMLTFNSGTWRVTRGYDALDEGRGFSMDADTGVLDIHWGTLLINGDARDRVNGYIDQGAIIGFGGTSTPVVSYTPVKGEPGWTTLRGVPEPTAVSLLASLLMALGGVALLRRLRA